MVRGMKDESDRDKQDAYGIYSFWPY